MTDKNLLEIKEYYGEGYKPVIDYDKWRVAILNYCEELLPENISNMQKHDQTDEVFVLLKGECTLFIADGTDEIGNIYARKLKPLKMYNVKKSVWHTHTLSEDAMVLIIENKNTSENNSPVKELSKEQQQELVKLL
ncbi:MAG: cupin domain-containing protein [Halanaerobiales bacterium]